MEELEDCKRRISHKSTKRSDSIPSQSIRCPIIILATNRAASNESTLETGTSGSARLAAFEGHSKAYAHPGWIPLARDWGGNNIAVDLAPGPVGKWGQIIIFGRDYDCKYVIARSWAAFLATVADDMCSEKVFVDEETQELKLREFKTQTVEPAYLDILRWRADQKYGRKGPRRRPGPGVNTHSHPHSNSGSPYGSPTEERGRSPQRFPPRGPTSTQSPRGAIGKPSPLAQVSEENLTPKCILVGMQITMRLYRTRQLVKEMAIWLRLGRPQDPMTAIGKSAWVK